MDCCSINVVPFRCKVYGHYIQEENNIFKGCCNNLFYSCDMNAALLNSMKIIVVFEENSLFYSINFRQL